MNGAIYGIRDLSAPKTARMRGDASITWGERQRFGPGVKAENEVLLHIKGCVGQNGVRLGLPMGLDSDDRARPLRKPFETGYPDLNAVDSVDVRRWPRSVDMDTNRRPVRVDLIKQGLGQPHNHVRPDGQSHVPAGQEHVLDALDWADRLPRNPQWKMPGQIPSLVH